jgi:DNA-binding NtrC family response regulator
VKTVLYIDDNKLPKAITKQIYLDSEVNLLLANTVKDAITVLNIRNVDIVLLDVVIGKECGIAILEHIIKAKLKPRVVVTISQFEKCYCNFDRFASLNIEFLHKPFNVEAFLNILNCK